MKLISAIFGVAISVMTATAYATDLNVYVKNAAGVPLPGAGVVAVRFGDGGPDGSGTRIGVADAAGLVSFSGGNTLVAGSEYDIFAGTQGFLPSLSDQFNDPSHPRIIASGTLADITITVSSAGVSGIGQINVDVEGATPNSLVFGEIRPASGYNQEAMARGATMTDGAGNANAGAGGGPIAFLNVPYTSTTSYRVEGFDPATSKRFSFPGTQELAAYRPLARYTSGSADPLENHLLNFANAIQQQNTQNVNQQFGVTGEVSVTGVVIGTTTAEPIIPYIGVNFSFMRSTESVCQGCPQGSQNIWAHVDASGGFQLSGLQKNTTYYAQIYGGCVGGGNQACYDGYNSTWTSYSPATSAPLGLNDFYYAAAPIIKKIKLNRAAGGTGTMAVYVKDGQGQFLPQTGVSLWPDGMQWETGGNCAANQKRNNPGLANFNGQATTGYVLISNLPAGNYSLQAWTQFSQSGGTQFNAGPDGSFSWGGSNCPSDDFRLTIDTTTANNVRIYDAAGVLLQSGTSVTISVTVPQQTTGLVKGTLQFPGLVDLSEDPINITLQPRCSAGPCSGGGYHVVSGSTGPTYNYEVRVASGQSYWMNVTSNYWGIVRVGGGNNQITLTSTGTAIVNMTFAPAGRFQGKLYKPGNVLFTPTFSQNDSVSANINLSGQNSWGWGQVNQDGSFSVGGLLPGKYKARVNGWGNFAYTDPDPVPEVTIAANQDTYRDLNVVEGVPVRILVTTTSLPGLNSVACPNTGDDWGCPPESWTVIPMPKGMSLSEKMGLILDGGQEASAFAYAVSTGSNRCNGPSGMVGFCIQYKPAPSVADFYLLRKGEFDSSGLDRVRPYFVVLNSTKNVSLTKSALDPSPFYWVTKQSTVSVINLNMTPANPALVTGGSGQSTLKGTVIAQNIIRQVDFNALGGDFNNFMKYIPIVTLYDSSGALKAAGLVIPDPTCFDEQGANNRLLEESIAAGNWSGFLSAFGNCVGGWGYEIRGLSAGEVYKAVLTTPNYPPYDNRVTMGVAGSTVTLNINMDVEVGSGATLLGVVTTTNSVTISTALVTLEAPGYNNGDAKSFTTGSAGEYKFEGLPKGTYKIGVTASGYSLALSKIDLSGNTTFTRNIALRVAGGTITGTVRAAASRERLSGVKIYAYNDTFNVLNPSSELSLHKTETSTSGYYSLEGLESTGIYKVFAKAPGYFIASASTGMIAGVRSGIDFQLVKKPLDVEVFARRVGSDFEFTVLNPGDFSDGDAWVGGSPFVLAGSTNVGNGFQEQIDSSGNKILVLKYPVSDLTAGTDYILHIEAKAGVTIAGVVNKNDVVTKEVLFGLNRSGCASQGIDDIMLGDDSTGDFGHNSNQAPIDVTGANDSALGVPAGAMVGVSTYVVPALSMCQQTAAAFTPAAAVPSGAFVSDVYQVTLSSLSFTNKGFDVKLAYDKSASNLTDIAIYHYNSTTAQWEAVSGLQTIDPVKGTITTRVQALSTVAGLPSSHSMKAMVLGGTYVPNTRYRIAASGDSGSFAILRPSLAGAAYSGSALKVFNFPNPFNLSPKTVSIVHGGATTSLPTTGTVIKYELPAGTNGPVRIRIYAQSGELVDELDEGDKTGGKYYYTTWDGKNGKGVNVANGVYFGVLSVPGQKAKNGTFKLAVVK